MDGCKGRHFVFNIWSCNIVYVNQGKFKEFEKLCVWLTMTCIVKSTFLPSYERNCIYLWKFPVISIFVFLSETDELVEVVDYLETKSVVNPKEIALAKREEMKKKGEIKSPGKKPGRKSGLCSIKMLSS